MNGGKKSKVVRIPEIFYNFLISFKGKHSSQEIFELLLKDYKSENELKKRINKNAITRAIEELISWIPKRKETYELVKFILLSIEELPEEDGKKIHEQLNHVSDFAYKLRSGKTNIGDKNHTKTKNVKNKDLEERESGDSDEHDKKEKVVSEALTEILQDDPNFLTSEVEDPVFILQSKVGEKLGEESTDIDEETISKVLESERKQNGGVFE